jgi:alpha-1,4-galacturonosyltransferase
VSVLVPGTRNARVIDTLNYGATVMWFRANPPGRANMQIQNVDTFQWLNSSYSPVLKQLETESMMAYFKSDKERVSANLKYRNPKYLSMLNHLFPKLDKILFQDDDITRSSSSAFGMDVGFLCKGPWLCWLWISV